MSLLAVREHPQVTLEALQTLLPARKKALTQEVVDILNKSTTEPEFQGESLLQSMVTYERVLQGRASCSIMDYLNALRFCAYMVSMDDNYTEAYTKTFCTREFVTKRMTASTDSAEYNELTSAASRYRRSKLVVDILTQSQVPLELLFMGGRYKACMVLMDRMENSKFDKDKISAAKELLAATKGADNFKIDLGVTHNDNSATQNMMEQLACIAARQQALLESGAASLQEFGALRVINSEVDNEA